MERGEVVMAYTLATGLLWLKDIGVESDSKTMSGTCKNAGEVAQEGTGFC